MKNILLPTDFSENSWNAIKYAVNFFEKEACNFYLLHVNKPSDIVTNEAEYIESQNSIENVYVEPARQKLHKIRQKISQRFPENKAHKFYTLTGYNFFIKSIRECVEEKKIDCIVIGTKGASGLKKIIVGSNTGDVITKVKCTTFAIPERAEFRNLKEIAFPTDFSLTYDIQILDTLREILEKCQATLRILHIRKNKTDLNTDQYENKELLDYYFNSIPHSFHYLTNKKVEDAVQCFVESRNINMICMVAKNLNYFQQILFHSKVEEISYHIEVPFLVLHEKP
ncbi:universal stress protein [Hyunsoonleella rubra]|uniref:Universal stress protein n=1 Tax=Hyunsoonleella rubra TaxID=1737062 RepID=A0ABW5T888_9FLAO